MSSAPWNRPTFASGVFYTDPLRMLDWLETAFGFKKAMVITAGEAMVHAEMRYGDGYVMVGGEWNDGVKSPGSIGGYNTQGVHVHLTEDVDAHCERARAAGARIAQEPSDQFYGDRTYRAVDPEGHAWTFAQTKRFVSKQEAEAATGLKIEGWPEG